MISVHFLESGDIIMAIFAPGDTEKIKRYPYLNEYTSFLKKMERPLVGRNAEMMALLAAMQRPELCNVILLANAGSGKTALVQGTMLKDKNRAYLEVNLPRMIANLKNENEMADKLKRLFQEVVNYRKEYGREIVLFIDEFHQIVQLSTAAVEVLKPLLADSGTRGIRVIAATTYIEFQDYISPNQPLVERLQRINLAEPDKNTVVQILHDMAEKYGVMNQFRNDSMFEAIYEYTNRYVPANAQPRKSILMLDSMIGWHRFTGRPIDMRLLADVIYDTEGVNITFRVDAKAIKQKLDSAVLAQEYASTAIENRLQICCADLNNKNKPMSSFLFTGSTGVGKATTCNTDIPVYGEDGHIHHKKAGKVKPGDYVFNRRGRPVKVMKVFPQGQKTVYRVTLDDGRILDTADTHLWSVYKNNSKEFITCTTKDIMQMTDCKVSVPMNGAVYSEEIKDLPVHPYIVGAVMGSGFDIRNLNGDDDFIITGADESMAKHIAEIINAVPDMKRQDVYGFKKNDNQGVQFKDVFANDFSDMDGEGVPYEYMCGSIEQRLEFLSGLFDIGAEKEFSILENGSNHCINYVTMNRELVCNIKSMLYSLGTQCRINTRSIAYVDFDGKHIRDEYCISLNVYKDEETKYYKSELFSDVVKSFTKAFKTGAAPDRVGISSIEKLGYKEDMICFYVDDDEHLYQAGEYIVTHNTEMTKQLAKILFNDENKLIRMDMTEYALDESLERFRDELTTKVWARPYSIVLLDEIEKACASVTRLLLQVLDDGRLIDRNNREVTFKNCYIVITTNAGSEIYKTIAQYNADDKGSGKFVEKYQALIRESIIGTTGGSKFPPELLGRIDCIVPFQPLSEHTMGLICKNKLRELQKLIYSKYHITVRFSEDIIRYIVQEKMTTNSDAGGARAVISRLEQDVTTKVSRFINYMDKKRIKNNEIYVYVEGDMATDNKYMLESMAYIGVGYNMKK